MSDDYSKLYKYRHTNWSGGQRDEVKPSLLQRHESAELYDVNFDQAGTLYPSYGHADRFRYGSITNYSLEELELMSLTQIEALSLNEDLVGSVNGIGYFSTSAGANYLIVIKGTSVYSDDLSQAVPVLVSIGTVGAGTSWSFANLNNKMYMTNGTNKMYTWDGATLTELAYLVAPVKQKITTQVRGTVSVAGNAAVVITKAGMTGSPYSLSVAVLATDSSKVVADKIVAAINANATINSAITATNVGSTIDIEADTATDTDSTMSIYIDNDTCKGLGTVPTSLVKVYGMTQRSYYFSCLEVNNGMLWGAETNSSRVRWSKILDGTVWEPLNFIDLNPSDGDTVQKIIKYQSYMVVMKKRSRAVITGNTTANYAVSWLEGAGTAGPHTVEVANGYLTYIASDGVHMTNLVTDTLISKNLDDSWKSRVNLNALGIACVGYWRNYVFVALPTGTSTSNTEVWVYDVRYHSWVILRNLLISNFIKAYVYGDEVMFGSDTTVVQVYQLCKYDATSYPDGTPIKYKWRSADWTFDYPERYKLYRNIYLELEGVIAEDALDMSIYLDDVEYPVTAEDVTIPVGEGDYHSLRLIPPIYGAVLGQRLAIRLEGRTAIRSISVEYSIRSNIPPGGVI